MLLHVACMQVACAKNEPSEPPKIAPELTELNSFWRDFFGKTNIIMLYNYVY